MWPGEGFCGDDQARALQGNVRVEALEVKVRGDNFMFQGQDGFDQPSDPGSRLQVANVGLDRAQNEWRQRAGSSLAFAGA